MNALAMRMLPLVALAPILSACATMASGGTEGAIAPPAIRRMCEAWPNVTWSSRDTPETIADAKANNAARAGFCESGG